MKDKKKRFKTALQLFLTFFKIGAFTFGGGYAMLPLIQHETVEKKGWISDDDILEIVAIAESTPGPFAINSATFVGYRTAGVLGSFCATLGVVLPSFIIISIIARLLSEFQDIKAVKYAFWGIRAGVLSLIVKALYNMYKKVEKNAVSYIAMGAALLLTAFLGVNVLIVIALCAVFGLVTSIITARRAQK